MDYKQMAIDFMDKQASVRPMTPGEYAAGVAEAEEQFRKLYEPAEVVEDTNTLVVDPKTAIKDRSITCCVCGKSMRVITKSHLLSHGLTPESYRELCGYKKGTPLITKSLQRERRNKMSELRLWERDGSGAQRAKNKAAAAAKVEPTSAPAPAVAAVKTAADPAKTDVAKVKTVKPAEKK